jgi:hypothetical protein
MVTILCALVSIFEFRVRSRASLELELIALLHQVTVLRRQRPGRPQLSSLDRLLWVWLCRIWPQVIDAMVLVKPATVVQWHRKGFRLATDVRIPREPQDVALPLVVPLRMVMLDIFAQGPPQGALTEQNHLGQVLILHRPDPAFRIGIQVRAARRQHERFDLS